MDKKILLLITNLNFGGAQRVFHTVSEVLSKQFTVVECVFNRDGGVAFPSDNELLSLDVPAGTNLVDKTYRFFQRVIRLRKIKRKFKIDVCISHLEGADLVNVLSGRSKTISWVHGSKLHDKNISGLLGFVRHRLLIPFTYSKSDLVVTVSEDIKRELEHSYNVTSRLQTLHNFFDIESLREKSQAAIPLAYDSAFKQSKVIICSSRLAEQKNLRELLRWFAQFVNVHPCKLVIIGDGELRNELLMMASQLQLNAYHPWAALELHENYQLYFFGFQENPHAFVSKGDVFILPSSWEGFPMALGEAMACGTAVVSADCPTGPREFLSDEIDSTLQYPSYNSYGVLLPMLNPAQYRIWNDAVWNVLSDEEIRSHYRLQALKRADFFSLRNNSTRIIDIVKTL